MQTSQSVFLLLQDLAAAKLQFVIPCLHCPFPFPVSASQPSSFFLFSDDRHLVRRRRKRFQKHPLKVGGSATVWNLSTGLWVCCSADIVPQHPVALCGEGDWARLLRWEPLDQERSLGQEFGLCKRLRCFYGFCRPIKMNDLNSNFNNRSCITFMWKVGNRFKTWKPAFTEGKVLFS